MMQSYCQTKARDRGVKARKPEGIQKTSVLVIFSQHTEKKLGLWPLFSTCGPPHSFQI
jgi:hypothetical protein